MKNLNTQIEEQNKKETEEMLVLHTLNIINDLKTIFFSVLLHGLAAYFWVFGPFKNMFKSACSNQ